MHSEETEEPLPPQSAVHPHFGIQHIELSGDHQDGVYTCVLINRLKSLSTSCPVMEFPYPVYNIFISIVCVIPAYLYFQCLS